MTTYTQPTITEIKKAAKEAGVQIKKSRSYLNGNEAWEMPNGALMTKQMLVNAFVAGELF